MLLLGGGVFLMMKKLMLRKKTNFLKHLLNLLRQKLGKSIFRVLIGMSFRNMDCGTWFIIQVG